MEFEYFAGEQRSPEWFKLRRGRVTASRLVDWLAVSKRDDSPLKARLDYERELAYESAFGLSYEHYVTKAMQDGIDYEPFVREQYNRLSDGHSAEECGAWYNDRFLASPDGVIGQDGLLEVKVVGANSFSDVLINGIPNKWLLQVQGQLWASNKDWCDFTVANLASQKLKVIRVFPDEQLHKRIEQSLKNLGTLTIDTSEVLDFTTPTPAIADEQRSISW